jgi:elongator complex protein 2
MMTFQSQDDRALVTYHSISFPSTVQITRVRMAQASASVAYIAAAANRFPYTADISPESLVAFGSHKFVSLWNLDDESIHATIPGHEGVVTCLRFVSESCFVSGDDKGIIRCWKRSGSQVMQTHLTQAARR